MNSISITDLTEPEETFDAPSLGLLTPEQFAAGEGTNEQLVAVARTTVLDGEGKLVLLADNGYAGTGTTEELAELMAYLLGEAILTRIVVVNTVDGHVMTDARLTYDGGGSGVWTIRVGPGEESDAEAA